MNLKVDEWGRGGEGQGMVVTRQGKMSAQLWVDVDVVDDMVVVVFIAPVALFVDDAFDFVVVDVFIFGDSSDDTRKVSGRRWVDVVFVVVVADMVVFL